MQKLLIANRGEIARRIARSARRLGIAVATVHSSADRDALHVRDIGESIAIGGAAASQSYLNAEAILRAARRVGADAIHPGIGFLAEDPVFAAAVESSGLVFVGPTPDTMRRFGDKWSAKHEASLAQVPVIGGTEGSLADAAAITALIERDMHLPVVLKAAAGGGGRGVRIIRSLDGLRAVVESAMREAQSSFGRPDLIVEQFIENARHLEVQIVGDGRGSAIHLYERECSLQRRFQKVIEEAPAAHLPADLRERILADAVTLARRVDYRNVGTMEFLVSGGRHYFLECNPRLQVEHTVTEEVTGIDLVELQLQIAAHGTLPLAQRDVVLSGHAIQARVNAESAALGFIPSTGRLRHVTFPSDVRVETGVEAGSEITPHYDSMIAKLIARGLDRSQALDRLLMAVEASVVFGLESNLGFLQRLLRTPQVRSGLIDNRFIDREFPPQSDNPPPIAIEHAAIASALLLLHRNRSVPDDNLGLWSGDGSFLAWRSPAESIDPAEVPAFFLCSDRGPRSSVVIRGHDDAGIQLAIDGAPMAVRLRELDGGRHFAEVGELSCVVSADIDGDQVHLQMPRDTAERFTVVPFLSLEVSAAALGGVVRAPMMGVLASVRVRPGQPVQKGELLIVQESMKMELTIEAPCDGTVSSVRCAEGAMVERHQILVEIMPGDSSDGAARAHSPTEDPR